MDTKTNGREEHSAIVEHKTTRVRLDRDMREEVKDEIVVEDQIELYVNNVLYAVFSCSPYETRELAAGHLLAEGAIRKAEEITGLECSKGTVRVSMGRSLASEFQRKPKLIATSCLSGTLKIPPHLLMRRRKVRSNRGFKLSRETIFGAVKVLNTEASVFRRTGGTHASALLDEDGNVLAFSEDIGRHNAVDKVIGKNALKGGSFARTLLASTGRMTFEMIVKAATVGIPVVVSMSAPTDKAVKTAEMFGLTLIGFARARRFNIYAWPERIAT